MDSTNLEQLFATVRAVNQKLPASRRLRVLAGDPPIDWGQIHSGKDFSPWLEQRDLHYARVVEREVLARGRKALLIIGGAHLERRPPPGDDPKAAMMLQILERQHPGKTFVVMAHLGFGDRNAALEPRLASWPRPSLALLQGTWLGNLEAAGIGIMDVVMIKDGKPAEEKPPKPETLEDKADAYLYLGPRDALTMEPRSPDLFRDDAYLRELNRRHRLIVGQPLDRAELMKERPKKYLDNFQAPRIYQRLGGPPQSRP
jgi:hypothetical protein